MSRSKGVSSSTLALNSNSKIGLVRFLQLNPQPKMVEVLLKAKYKKKVMTESEWLTVVEEIMDKNVKG